jgi:hypothetical protein
VGVTEAVLALVRVGVLELTSEAVPSQLEGVAREEMLAKKGVLDTEVDPVEEGEPVGVTAITVGETIEDRDFKGDAVVGGLLDPEGEAVEDVD